MRVPTTYPTHVYPTYPIACAYYISYTCLTPLPAGVSLHTREQPLAASVGLRPPVREGAGAAPVRACERAQLKPAE